MSHEILNIITTVKTNTSVRNGSFEGYLISKGQIATIENALSKLSSHSQYAHDLLDPSSPITFGCNSLDIEIKSIEVQRLRDNLPELPANQRPAQNEKINKILSEIARLRRNNV
jgi:hypothetical protein